MARRKPIIGLDIGSSAVKLCVLTSNKSHYALQSFGMMALPPEAIVDGALMNTHVVSDAIRELASTHHVKTKNVAFSVSGHSVIIKKISLPSMSESELEEQIRWEAEQYIPFDINDVNLDVHILKPAATPQSSMEVLLVAVKKEVIHEYMQVLNDAGLHPLVCDVDVFALENAFEINYDVAPNETIVLVNIGATKASINVITKGISSFTREINVGGNTFSEELQKKLGLNRDQAETIKMNEAKPTPEHDQLMQQVSENIAGEIQRTLDFYAATSADNHFSKLYLAGGASHCSSLAKKIENRLGTSVELIQSFRRIEIDQAQFDPDYIHSISSQATVAVGLALRAPE